MRNLARTSTVLAALLGVSGVLAIAAVGCGGDDTAVGGDGQADATADQTTSDVVTADQTATDGKVTHKDGGKDDGGSQHDGGEGDSSGDAVSDAVSDADAAPVEAAPVDAAALYAFPTAVNTAYCTRLATCCDESDAGEDAGVFIANCVAEYSASGGIADVNLANVHGGHMAYNAASAEKCLNDIAAFQCGSYTETQWLSMLSDCSAAMSGTIPLNSGGCRSAWDCEFPAFCKGASGTIDTQYLDDGGVFGAYVSGGFVSDGGGMGTCTELNPSAGSPCTDGWYYTDCNLYGNGTPQYWCNQANAGEAGACVANFAPGNVDGGGAGCAENQQCTTQICNPNFAVGGNSGCETTNVFSDPGPGSVICAGAASY